MSRYIERGIELFMHPGVVGIKLLEWGQNDLSDMVIAKELDVLQSWVSSGFAVLPAMIAANPPTSRQPEIRASAGCRDFSP